MSKPNLTFLGAARTVTGSCTLVEYKNTRVLIDCGMAQGHNKAQKLPPDPAIIDAIVMTHGHLDHTGFIPKLVEQGFRGPVFGQYATCEIAKIIWEDTLKIAEASGEQAFSPKTLVQTKNQLLHIAYSVPFRIGSLSLKFHDAGHIMGSSHVLIEADDRRILFSGDIGPLDTPIICDPTSAWDKPVHSVVIESTYGDRTHKNRDDTVQRFAQLVKQIASRKGVLLIPAFAIGRTQEILYHLNTLVESGDVPALPVLVDSPMAADVTSIYKRYKQNYDSEARRLLKSGDNPLHFRGLTIVESHNQSRSIPNLSPPFIVIAGSGMCTGGRILGHLKTFLPRETTTVLIVGYQAEGTLGRELVQGAEKVVVDGEQIEVNAAIETLSGFSAHADRDGLLNWARAVPGKDIRWYVNHGESRACEALAQALRNAKLGEAHVAELGDKVCGF